MNIIYYFFKGGHVVQIQSIGYEYNKNFGSKSLIPSCLNKESATTIANILEEIYVNSVPREFLTKSLESDCFSSGISANIIKLKDVVSNGIWLKKETLFNGEVKKFSKFQKNGKNYGYWFDDYGNYCRGENTTGPDYLALKEVRWEFPNNYVLRKIYQTIDASGNLNAVQFYKKDPLFDKPVGEICNFIIDDGRIVKQDICNKGY